MEAQQSGDTFIKTFRVSWTAYFWLIFWFAVKVAILAGIYYLLLYFLEGSISEYEQGGRKLKPEDEIIVARILGIGFWTFITLLTIGTFSFILKFLKLRSVILFVDNDGVWVHRGIFPWSKGINGVKWRDIDSASFITGFFSWLLRTYDIRVGHRFTKESEIVLYSIFNGHKAICYINEMHRDFIANTVPDA